MLDWVECLFVDSVIEVWVCVFVFCIKGEYFGVFEVYEELYWCDLIDFFMIFGFVYVFVNVGLLDKGFSLLKEVEKFDFVVFLIVYNSVFVYFSKKEYFKVLFYFDKVNWFGFVLVRIIMVFL